MDKRAMLVKYFKEEMQELLDNSVWMDSEDFWHKASDLFERCLVERYNIKQEEKQK